MNWLAPVFERYAEIPVFLAIGLGYWIGKFKIGGVGFGPVTGSLLAGVLIGNFWHVPVSDTAKSLVFLLFMYGIGFSAGPGFVRGVRDGGWRWVALAVWIPVMGLLTSYALAVLLKLELGYAAGLMSGALTESPIIGTASEAIRSLPLAETEKQRLIAQIPVADALTYVFGTFGVIFFCSYLGPRLLRIDLKAEALALEKEMGFERHDPGIASAWHMFELRAYELHGGSAVAGKTIEQVESLVSDERIFVERIRRDGLILEASPDLVLKQGDVVAVIGHHASLVRAVGERNREVFDRELLDVPSATFDVVLRDRNMAGRPLQHLRDASPQVRGVFLKAVRRGSEQIPVMPGTRLMVGDVVTLHGLEPAVRRACPLIGELLPPGNPTSYLALGLAIFAGALLGVVLSFPAGGVHVALGSSVATLLVGLAMGWRNSVRPTFGALSEESADLMKSIGLAAFVAMIGLKAGPVFVQAIKEIGLTVFLAGIVVTLVPQFTGLLFGRYVLRLNPLLLLGALAGAQTMTAGLAAVQERSNSPVAVIGYSSTVAFGHVLLSIGGTVLVWMLA
ncbi:TrkA C-terminal domain-containing protein [Variovorax sp. J22P168]|uniref:aspartate-alanine antiporter-like transporter n=1 Tax=Variovorax jilinensis TaxID=3053513 RepID=UPI002575C6C5|nr:TrkA C-terminal domain-containing protein [Variovorax sp. J22P168]MDM0015374.1 TrkA C-terminal domain-containing protein [Variovorax sp. J22P168]